MDDTVCFFATHHKDFSNANKKNNKMIITRIKRTVNTFIQMYRTGGCVKANISYIQQETLLKGKNILITEGDRLELVMQSQRNVWIQERM